VDIAYLRLSGWTHPQLVASDAGESILCHEGLRRVFPMNWGGGTYCWDEDCASGTVTTSEF